MNLKELIAKFREEWAKGDKGDKEVLGGLIDEMDPIASRDYATIKRLEKKAEGKTDADVSALEEKIEELNASLEKAIRESTRAATKHAEELKAANDGSAAKSAKLSELIRDKGLAQELIAVGVKNPVHLKATQAMLRELVQVDEEKGEAFVLAKDPKTGAETRKSLSDFAKEWAQSDEGKSFVTVPGSSGGGSAGPGSGAGSAGKTMSRASFETLDPAARLEFSRAGGTLTE
jgi:hypothetical protein